MIDVSGLAFLAPVVRLCYGEEPQVQLKKIGQWIVVPLLAVIVGIFVYNVLALKVDTKSGKLPVSSAILSSFGDINDLHTQEKLKEQAYELEGEGRTQRISEVEALLKEAEQKITEADKVVTTEEEKHQKALAEIMKPVEEKYAKIKTEADELAKSRKATEAEMAEALTVGDEASYDALLAYMRETKILVKEQTEEKNKVRKEVDKVRETEFPVYAAAKKSQTKAVELKAFYESYLKILNKDNKSVVIASKTEKIQNLRSEMLALTGKQAYSKAKSIVREESSIEKKKESSYAGAKTIWFQVQRSILCVFTGFFIGSFLAIPIGILCGLNKTFMAAMTPFIAIFKPVSPIVWLPIVLIVVTGFFPDADKHPVMLFLWDLPLIGHFKINPAFIASALTVALCSLWATMANTALGVASIDKDHMNVARVLKLGFFSRLVKIIIPSSLPLIFAGLRISLGVGWMVLIAAELLSSSEGIGKFVFDEFNNGSSDSLAKMIVVVFIVGVIGLILDRIMVIFQRLVSFEGSPATV